MFVQAFFAVWNGCIQVWGIFLQLLDSFGFAGLTLSLFGISVVIRFLLVPLFGTVSSDLASSSWKVMKGRISSRIRNKVSSQKGSKK